MPDWVSWLPHVNASLNSLATILLVIGFILVKRKQELAHRNVMLACFGVSVVFLACYVTYHAFAGSKRFPSYPPDVVRYSYYVLLASHVILAATVPVLALLTIYSGLRDQRARHRKLAKWTFPIWLYVSVTGVLVYLLLYHFFPPRPTTAKITGVQSTTILELPS